MALGPSPFSRCRPLSFQKFRFLCSRAPVVGPSTTALRPHPHPLRPSLRLGTVSVPPETAASFSRRRTSSMFCLPRGATCKHCISLNLCSVCIFHTDRLRSESKCYPVTAGRPTRPHLALSSRGVCEQSRPLDTAGVRQRPGVHAPQGPPKHSLG